MSWQFNRTEAVFVQIANRLRQEILNGTYPSGMQIPPVRQLAFDAAVNPNTVQKALSLLEAEGLLHAHATVGRFVTSDVEVLEAARKKAREETIRALVREMEALGITKQDLIDYLEKEESSHEHPDPDLHTSEKKL